MKEKRNELWKLDLLEAKYTQATPRFSFTKKLINARNNSHLMKKLPSTPNEAFQQIHALKSDLFRKKYHGSYKKLSRDVTRATKQKQKSSDGKSSKQLEKLMQSAEFHDQLITAKLVKIIQSAMLTTKETRQNPPTYISEEVREYLSDKSSSKNPSRFFITYCQNDKVVNDYISKLWNSKDIKTLCSEIEWTFRKIRGNLTKDELALRSKDTGKNTKNVTEDANSEESDDDESDDSGSEEEREEIDPEEAFEKFAGYDNLVAGSDDEQEFVADPNVDYNEITDEEMSEAESDESESPKETKAKASKEKKVALPQLATGYFSGGSDDEDEDVDNDKIVKEATTTRKNRRGQRARQKIWEQKYGKKAIHVQKENQRLASEREIKQQEFEERQRKRELKAKLAQENNSSKTAGSSSSAISGDSSKVHPSWEAKKIAEEKMKNVKFQGKKITFD